jgi:hypothetical protein
MAALSTHSRTELAHRSTLGLDVTLFWVRGEDALVVCVRDAREGAYFEIPAAAYLALDVYYHPFAYREFRTAESSDARLAA